MFSEDIPPHLLPDDSEWGFGIPPASFGFYWVQLAPRGIPWKDCEIWLAYLVPEEGLYVLRKESRLMLETYTYRMLRDYAVRYIKAIPTTQRRPNGTRPD